MIVFHQVRRGTRRLPGSERGEAHDGATRSTADAPGPQSYDHRGRRGHG